jgi:benzoyl-CoA reductase/2-hydroxyglutaryl-CoA dehydratase subunit BcrC/BadD/HgdB
MQEDEGVFIDPTRIINSRKDRPLAVVFSSYFPLEILDAFGFYAVTLPNIPITELPNAEAGLESFVCHPVRSWLEVLLGGEIRPALVVTQSGCDARVVLCGVIREALGDVPCLTLSLPIVANDEKAATMAKNALLSFSKDVEDLFQKKLDLERLVDAIAKRQEVRSRCFRVFSSLEEYDSTEAYKYAIASQIFPPDEFLALPLPKKALSNGVYALLSGSSIPSVRFIEDIKSLGIKIAVDDTCTGIRQASRQVEEDKDLFYAIAKSIIFRRFHGPTMVCKTRQADVVGLAKEKDVKLAILFIYKFCDPHFFEAPALCETLRNAGIFPISIEVDSGEGLLERNKTMLKSALESLG